MTENWDKRTVFYEKRKIFHSIVGNNDVVWVVRLWKNFNSFHYQLSKCTIAVQIWSEKVKKVFWNMSQIGLCRTVLCGRRKNINYFHFQLSKWHFHFPIWCERRTWLFSWIWKQINIFIPYMKWKKYFQSNVGTRRKKSNSFKFNNTNRHLADSVMRKEENRPMIAKMYRSICIYNGKVLDFGYISPLFQRGI